jgi:hypothetical protein
MDAFDTVCEVEGSDWVSALYAVCAPVWRGQWVMRHFMIYVNGFGCVKVAAESVLLDDNSTKNLGGT